MHHRCNTVPVCHTQPSLSSNQWFSQTRLYTHTNGCITTPYDPSSSYQAEHFSVHPLHFLEVQPERNRCDKIKNILSTKQHMHLNRPPIPVLAIEHWKLSTQITIFVHLQPCEKLRSHQTLVFLNPVESRNVILLRFRSKVQHELKKRNQSHNASPFTRVSMWIWTEDLDTKIIDAQNEEDEDGERERRERERE